MALKIWWKCKRPCGAAVSKLHVPGYGWEQLVLATLERQPVLITGLGLFLGVLAELRDNHMACQMTVVPGVCWSAIQQRAGEALDDWDDLDHGPHAEDLQSAFGI